jgi:hypothetical protein
LSQQYPNITAVLAGETQTANGVMFSSTNYPQISVLLQGVSASSLSHDNFRFS